MITQNWTKSWSDLCNGSLQLEDEIYRQQLCLFLASGPNQDRDILSKPSKFMDISTYSSSLTWNSEQKNQRCLVLILRQVLIGQSQYMETILRRFQIMHQCHWVRESPLLIILTQIWCMMYYQVRLSQGAFILSTRPQSCGTPRSKRHQKLPLMESNLSLEGLVFNKLLIFEIH